MSNTIAPTYTPDPLYTPQAKANAAASSSSAGSSAATGLGTTFLSLLVKELQNQDPTAPMDSTAMVGQMISLNQLDQLININQTLGGSSSSVTGAVQSATAARSAATIAPAAATANAATTQLPFDPNTLMPLTPTNAAASVPSINSPLNAPLNAASMGFTGSR